MSLLPPSTTSRASSRSPSPSRPESLLAHPLLASPSTSTFVTSSPNAPANAADPAQTPPKYLPYTPRGHRGATTAINTTSQATSTPPSSIGQQNGKNLQRKLQITNLQSTAQGLGLDVGSVGWAVLEWLMTPATSVNNEQKEIWDAISLGKVTLLLPLEQASGSALSAEFVKDHVALISGDKSQAITLSGLRGYLEETKLTVISSLSPSHPTFSALLALDTRDAAFDSLPPLPLLSSDAFNRLPTYTLPTHTSSLLIPSPNPPALPPRPVAAPNSTPGSGHSRLSTLASLFGGRGTAPVTPQPSNSDPLGGAQTASALASPSTPAVSLITQVAGYTCTVSIVRAFVGAKLDHHIKTSITGALALQDSEKEIQLEKDDLDWVSSRTYEIASPLLPLLKVKSMSPVRRVSRRTKQDGNPAAVGQHSSSEVWNVPFYDFDCQLDGGGKTSLLNAVQDGYDAVEQGIRDRLLKGSGDVEAKKQHAEDVDKTVGHLMTIVESSVCELLYDRLFGGVEDGAHDKALQQRALSLSSIMGLKELGLTVKQVIPASEGDALEVEEDGESGIEVVDGIVAQCAQVLSRLDDDTARTPGVKARLLVEAHRVFVEGFSNASTHRVWVEAHDEPEAQPESMAEVELVSSPEKKEEKPKPVITSPPPLSSDLLLPLLIYTILRYPEVCTSHLLSNLLFVQRFRCEDALPTDGSRTGRGEEAFCLVNLVAGVEYVVSLSAPSSSAEDASDSIAIPGAKTPPSPMALFHHSPTAASTKSLPPNSHPNTPSSIFGTSLPSDLNITSLRDIDMGAALKGRVDDITGGANRVISGVVGSSFGILKSLTQRQQDPGDGSVATSGNLALAGSDVDGTGAPVERPGALGILTGRVPSTSSGLSSIRNMLPSRLAPSGPVAEDTGRPLLVVSGSRPGSLRAPQSDTEGATDDETDSDEDQEGEDSGDGEDGDDDESDEDDDGKPYEPDTRSIRSFESMMRSSSANAKKRKGKKGRKTLSDRLADVSSGLAALKGSPRNSILPGSPVFIPPPSPVSSSHLLHQPRLQAISPPNDRFMNCDPEDLRIGEVGELLLDYRRLVEEMRAAGAFASAHP